MSDVKDYDPNKIYKEPVYSQQELNDTAKIANIGNGINPFQKVGLTNIKNDELEECSVPDDGMSHEQRETVDEWQARMGVGRERMAKNNCGRTYHYYR